MELRKPTSCFACLTGEAAASEAAKPEPGSWAALLLVLHPGGSGGGEDPKQSPWDA